MSTKEFLDCWIEYTKRWHELLCESSERADINAIIENAINLSRAALEVVDHANRLRVQTTSQLREEAGLLQKS